MLTLFAIACTTSGPQGPTGPMGATGPAGPMGPAGAAGPAVAFHWADEEGVSVTAGPELILFNDQGVAFGLDAMTGDLSPHDRLVYYEQRDCQGAAAVQVDEAMQAIWVREEWLVPLPGFSVLERTWGASVWNPDTLSCQNAFLDDTFLGVGPAAQVSDLVSAGLPPTRFWTGGLHRVPAAPPPR